MDNEHARDGRLPDLFYCHDYSAWDRLFRRLVPEGEIQPAECHGMRQKHRDPLTGAVHMVTLQRGVVLVDGRVMLGHRDLSPSRFRVHAQIDGSDMLMRMFSGAYVYVQGALSDEHGRRVLSGDESGKWLKSLAIRGWDSNESGSVIHWYLEHPLNPEAQVALRFEDGCVYWDDMPLMQTPLDGIDRDWRDGGLVLGGLVRDAMTIGV